MVQPTKPREVVRLGVFEIDTRTGEVRKQGLRIRLQNQPLQVLEMLLERPGELVTREELRNKLWPADTFVDFEDGLNTAINKLRQALGDSAENPRFVETLPRRGYRLIAPVEEVTAGGNVVSPDSGAQTDSAATERPPSGVSAAAQQLPARRRWIGAAIVVAVFAVAATVTWWGLRPKAEAKVIAVLPFKNLSSEPQSDYFSDGLTDEVIRNLSLIEGLEVKSRTSSFEFKDKPRNIREVGSQLGVNLVLEGAVLRAGDRLRINVDLVRVSDDSTVWTQRYDRELKDVFAIQDEISRSIVNELRLKNIGGRRRYNTNLEAYDLYLKAMALSTISAPAVSRQRASLALFEAAVTKDPGFAPAYAGMADAYATLASNPRADLEGADEKMRAAATKAIELDPLLAEAYDSMGRVKLRDLAWDEAERAFRRAVELDPNLSRVRSSFGLLFLFPLGKIEEALRQLRKAVELDPLSIEIRRNLAFVLVSTGRDDEALDQCRRVLAVRPNDGFTKQLYGRVLLHKGRVDQAVALFETLSEPSHGFLGYAYARAGRRDEAEKLAAEASPASARHQALIYAGLGDKDRTFAALQKMAAMGDAVVDVYPFYPELALLHDDPRVNQWRRQRGLPPIQ